MATLEDSAKVMVGGAKFQQLVLDWTQQSNQLYLLVFTSILLVWAVYAEKLSPEWRWQLSTSVGRLLLLLLLYIVYTLAGWIPALLFTVAVALTWANRPLWKPVGVPSSEEGFRNMKVQVVDSEKWFVEKVLEESPKRIVEDRVDTMAVQEESTTGTSRTSR